MQPLPFFTGDELKLPFKRQVAKYFIERGNYMISLQKALELPEISAAAEARRGELSLSGMPFSGREQERTVRAAIAMMLASGEWKRLVEKGAIKHFVPEEYVKNIEHGQYWVRRLSGEFGNGDIHKVGSQHYLEAGLKTFLATHGNSPIKILQHYFPDEADPFSLAKKPNGFCASEANQAEAIRRLKKTLGKPIARITKTDILSNGASGFLARAGDSLYKLAKTADRTICPENMSKAPNNTYLGKIIRKGKSLQDLLAWANKEGIMFVSIIEGVQAALSKDRHASITSAEGVEYRIDASENGYVLREPTPPAAVAAVLRLLRNLPKDIKISTTILNGRLPGFVKAHNGSSVKIAEEALKGSGKRGKPRQDNVSSADEAVFGKEPKKVVLHRMDARHRHPGKKWEPGMAILSEEDVLDYLAKEMPSQGRKKKRGKVAVGHGPLGDQLQLGIALSCVHFFRDSFRKMHNAASFDVSASYQVGGGAVQKQTFVKWRNHGNHGIKVEVCMFTGNGTGVYSVNGARQEFRLNGVDSGNLDALAAVLKDIRKAVSSGHLQG